MKSDLELTERCAKWMGYKPEGMLNNGFWTRDTTGSYGTTPTGKPYLIPVKFNPLHDMNDLWKVIERLPVEIKISLQFGVFEIWHYGKQQCFQSSRYQDYPRAILTLVAEMEEGR